MNWAAIARRALLLREQRRRRRRLCATCARRIARSYNCPQCNKNADRIGFANLRVRSCGVTDP